MFSTALIIFREVIEISLILGIVLAATKGLPKRMGWIALGFAGGISGAGLVAIFAEAISNAASGMGQEIFNAAILLIAALFIGWTVLWMKRHAREMSAHFREVSHRVREGGTPFYTLSLIIGLALLREGSEIVLFIYGMLLSGQSPASIVSGSVIGLIGGIVVGFLFYHGLLRLSARYMLTITSWLLIVLVAGLAAQSVGFLTQAGYFSNFSSQLWDSSWLLSENTIMGKILHSLVGYTAQPTEIQLAVYLVVLITLVLGAAMIDKRKTLPKVVASVALVLTLFSSTTAQALDKIHTPYVDKGEIELEYSGSRTSDSDREKNNAQGHELSIGYGFTDYWKAELATGLDRDPGSSVVVNDIELENTFQFSQPGEMWMDSGLLVSYIHALHKGDPDALEAKLLLQKDSGKFSHLANLGFEQGLGDNNHGGPDVSLLWNSRYRLNEHFQPGIEYQGDFGQTNVRPGFNKQEHFVGPAVYGKLLGNLGYQAGYLFGITDASPNSAGRILLEYEVHLN